MTIVNIDMIFILIFILFIRNLFHNQLTLI